MVDDKVVRQQLIAILRGGNAHLKFERAVSQFPLDYINRKATHISYSPCLLYTSPSPRDGLLSRMPSSA